MQLSDKILEATNGGLDIILNLYPDAEKSLHNKGNFRIRPLNDDVHPSAAIKLVGGVYIVTDFASGESYNAITLYMYKNNVDFTTAIKELGNDYNVFDDSTNKVGFAKPEFTFRDKKEEEKDGDVHIEYFDDFRDGELVHFGPYVDAVTARLQNISSVKSITRIKKGKAVIQFSTDRFPIFCYDYKDFKKIYQPLFKREKETDPDYRFSYVGKKPNDHFFNLDKVVEQYNHYVELKLMEDADSKPKLPFVVIASGDSDAMNFISLGFPTVWMNSETAKPDKLISELRKYTHRIIQVPDIDKTGKEQAYNRGLQFLDLYTAWIPTWINDLATKKPKKDFKDFCNHVVKSLGFTKNQLFNYVDKWLESSTTLQFWDEKYTKKEVRYQFNFESCIDFLHASGFGIYKAKTEDVLVYVQKNIVKRVDTRDVIQHLVNFLRTKNYPQKLRNMVLENRSLKDRSLIVALPQLELNFLTATKDSQLVHFKNTTFLVNKDGKSEIPRKQVKYHVWEDEIIDCDVRSKPSAFNYSFNKIDDLKIASLDEVNSNCLFFDFVRKTSNVFWRAEKIDGIMEQEINHHILNKLYCLGYLAHDYKQADNAWAVWAMEAEVIEDGLSHGGTGKSLFMLALKHFKGAFAYREKNGRNTELTKWPYDGVTEKTKIYHVGDCGKYVDFGFFYNNITGDIDGADKGGKMFHIPFEVAPKHVFTSNYVPKGLDGSTGRRLLYCMFSDYFHSANAAKNLQEHKPKDEYGKMLFVDFTAEDWNNFYNFMMDCIMLYLNCPWKIDPPMGNIEKRVILSTIGENFKEWADNYFNETKINCLVSRTESFNDFLNVTKAKNYTMRTFNNNVKNWCKFYGFTYNPKDIKGYSEKHGCIKVKVKVNDKILNNNIVESYNYICTKNANPDNELPF